MATGYSKKPYKCKKPACTTMQIFAMKRKKKKKIITKDPGKSFMALSYRENMKKKSEILLSLYEVVKIHSFFGLLYILQESWYNNKG